VASALYALILPLSIWLLRTYEFGAAAPAVALLPMLPVVLGVIVMVRMIDALDELQRRIQVQALGFSALVTGLGSFAYGLLERTGLPPLSLTWVLPAMIWLWGIGHFVARRRYK